MQYGRLDRIKEALEAFDRAIDLDPYDAIARNNRSVAFKKLGKMEQGSDIFDEDMNDS
jgi:Flp pilus assembly protein TadD